MKGGVIGATGYLISVLLLINCSIQPRGGDWFKCFGLQMLAQPAWSLVYALLGGAVNNPLDNPVFTPLTYLISLPYYVVPFTILGWLYGKIKNSLRRKDGEN